MLLLARFGSAQSIPQICRSLQKAAYDPRVCGILLKISPLAVCEQCFAVPSCPFTGLGLQVRLLICIGLQVRLKMEVQVGWARLQEIREYVSFFRQSGKFSMAFMTTGGEKEYYLASACEVCGVYGCSAFYFLPPLLTGMWLYSHVTPPWAHRHVLLLTSPVHAQEVYVPPTGNLSLRGLVVSGILPGASGWPEI